jgi:hypothetical protein
MTTVSNSRVVRTIPLLIIICLVGVSTQAETNRYIFFSEQSTLLQTSEIAGIHRTYTITGTFQLTANFETGTALFDQVDAGAVYSIPSRTGNTQHYNLDPNEVFNMTSLVGTIADGGESIRFDGTADDGRNIQITLTFADGSVSLKGETVPLPRRSDFFVYTLNAIAIPKYEHGSGTADDPYLICTAADLIALGENPNDYDKHFILTADIDLDLNLPGRKVFDKALIAPNLNPVNSWIFKGTPFTGVFDGNNNTISHLTISGSNYLGLFGYLDSKAKIFNLGLEAVDVNGTDSVGGLAGFNIGCIIRSYSSGTVYGDSFVGGLVGDNPGSINLSYNASTVAGDYHVGGLAGHNNGNITSSYNMNRVTGNLGVGGLVGRNAGGGDLGRGIITTSYSTGIVNGKTDVGGLVGSYWGGSIALSFWDMETSGQLESAGGTGLTTAEMHDINTFLDAGWDFVDETLNGTCDYWQISQGDYPKLNYHLGNSPIMPEGLGTANQPYLIRDIRDLGTVWFKPLAHYRLEESLDLSGITWSMAVIPCFGGTFDGNKNTIKNLHIQGGGLLGLFGQLTSGATISNLGLEVVNVNGSGDFVGGLAGESDFTCSIATSYCTGTVNGDHNIGGLVGLNWGGNITTSYCTSTVSGNKYVGGFVGSNEYGSITTSYSSGAVSGTTDIGGFVGTNWYGNIAMSFWDTQTSGQISSDGGTGKTTAEMLTKSTYLEAGWDFVEETANGTEDIWKITEGFDYPRLWWEKYSGGSGTAEDPYQIGTAEDLMVLGESPEDYDKHFILTADINLDPNLPGRKVFDKAVIAPDINDVNNDFQGTTFNGVFNGNGHTISHLTIVGDSYLGLFGQLEYGATISNLSLEAVDVNGTGDKVGGLVGSNGFLSIHDDVCGILINCNSTGTVKGDRIIGGIVGLNSGAIIQCYSKGWISGRNFVGGLVGWNVSTDSIVNQCYSTSTVNGTLSIGGLVGSNLGTVADSYSTAVVSGDEMIGGLVGLNECESLGRHYGILIFVGSISKCYSAGAINVTSGVGSLVGYSESIYLPESAYDMIPEEDLEQYSDSINKSFWDIEISGVEDNNEGGTSLTTVEMQTATTFLEAGWDFVDEIENGKDNIWLIDEGNDYPRLWWELISEN